MFFSPEKSKRRNSGKTIHTLTNHSSSLVESIASETFAEWLCGPVSMCKTKANPNPLQYIISYSSIFIRLNEMTNPFVP